MKRLVRQSRGDRYVGSGKIGIDERVNWCWHVSCQSKGYAAKSLSYWRRALRSQAMAQALHLSQKMTLSQVLAPQLQQSLALLQAPTLELKAMVAQELQQNPLLEELEVTEMSQEEKE